MGKPKKKRTAPQPKTKKKKAAAKARTPKPKRKVKAKPARAKARPTATKIALRPGDPAPQFRLPSDGGKELALDDLRGQWVVLYFYPRDNTPGCTREAIAFRDAAAELEKRGAVVIGISRDSLASHLKFRGLYGLNFDLLSDPSTETHASYGAFGDKVLYGKKITGALRTTVLIRPDGRIGRVFANVKVDGHDRAVLAAIDELSTSAAG